MLNKKNKKYFRFDGEKSQSFDKSVFLVRWFEDKSEKVNSEGPFKNPEHAEERCLYLLKSGVCAWLVQYNND